MIVHVFNKQLKFSKGFFSLLNKYGVDFENQILFHYGTYNECFNEIGLKTYFVRSWFLPFGHLRMLQKMFEAKSIIVHSLASPYLLMYLFFFKSLRQKVKWIVWGKDLYIYQMSKRKGVFLKMYEFFRKRVIKDIGYVVTAFEEDYLLAKKWYNVKGENIILHMFYPNSVDYSCDFEIKENKNSKYTLLLGNSASKTNEHIDALNKLANNFNEIEKIICPLSYGSNSRYVNCVISHGQKLFADKFVPLIDFIPFEQYKELLKSVDIAIFNHNRQEAIGNIYSLILQGKTVYLNETVTTAQFLSRNGVDFGKIDKNMALVQLNHLQLINNKKILDNIIDVEKNVRVWEKIIFE